MVPIYSSPFRVNLLAYSMLLILAAPFAAHAGLPAPTFSKTFLPAAIGPGSVSTLRFTITNANSSLPVTDLAFTDNLPAGVALASPPNASTTCTGGTVTAAGGGAAVSLSGGSVGTASSCLVSVDVTSGTIGSHLNVTEDLTSSAGNSGPASATLSVATDRPGFSKVFSPGTIVRGGRSTLTFTIDNSANASLAFNMSFLDPLPAGTEIAGPANATTNCTAATLTATPGGSLISFSGGQVAAGAACTVSVDVIGTGAGAIVNTSGELMSSIAGPLRSSGKATAVLNVQVSTVSLSKAFTDDPALPGGTVTLEFSLVNRDRDLDATAISFTDDLDATVAGLVATGLPAADVCGPGSSLSGTGLLTLSGGSLAANGGSCTFSLALQIPPGTAAGGYPNTTSALSADLGGSPFVGLPATETLFVNQAPSLTKTFLASPVGAGGTATVEFTLSNNSTTSAATTITFRDDLDTFISGTTAAALPPTGFCGAGSTLTAPIIGVDRYLLLSNGSLPPGGSCTFTADLAIPIGTAAADYLNTTENLSATVDGMTQIGAPASDTLSVVGAPSLRKDFTDDPVLPGGTVTLQFTLSYPDTATSTATAITFTDDLTATLSGLTAIGLPINDVCGIGSALSGTTNLTFSGGTLAPGATCSFGVTLQVPAGALPGSYPNATSSVMATVSGVTAVRGGGSDTLLVAGLSLAKSFTDDPVIAGGTATLQFTVTNGSPSADATAISFSDNLGNTLSGLTAIGLPINDVCGTGSQISGTTSLTLTGGNLLAGTSCTFGVTLQVPAGAADGIYRNTTSNLTATVNGMGVVLPPAADNLVVTSNLLVLTKEFTDDPVAPGGMVTLQFMLRNVDAGQAATGIAFTDDLDAALSGLVAIGLPMNDVCGIGSQISGTSLLTFSGGSLPAGGNCTFSVTLMVPAGVGGTATNTTGSVSGSIGGLPVVGDPASDVLQIAFLTFAKAFDAPTVPGGMPVLTFTIGNLSTGTVVSDLRFTDDLSAVLPGLVAVGLPANDVCGAGSSVSGTSQVTLNAGNLLPGGSCSIAVTLQVPAAAATGTYPNVTSDLFQAGAPAANPATANLQIEPPPTFAKAFSPAVAGTGVATTLTFTIDNTAAAIAASDLAFTDNLPAGVVIAGPANGSTSCAGGAIGATPGAGVVNYGAGTVGAGASCTVQVDVVANAPGTFVNTTGDLTSSSGNSGPASATLDAVESATFSKSFLSSPVLPGGQVSLQYTITNPSAIATLSAITFADDLGSAIPGLAAVGLPAADVCGVGSSISGAGVVTLSGGNLAPSGSCTFSVAVKVPANAPLGTVTSTSAPLTYTATSANGTTSGGTGPAAADLTIEFLSFGKTFAAGPFQAGDVVSLTFTIGNPDPANTAAGISFTDDLNAALPGLAAVGLPSAGICGAGSTISGTTLLTLSGGLLGPGETCTFGISVQLPDTTPTGIYTNVTSVLSATVDGTAVTGGAASVATADLDVLSPVTAIPTLGGWGLLLLAGLSLGVGLRRLRTGTLPERRS